MTAFPALEGQVVTEAHSRICREAGHATHTVGGVSTGICPRCGESNTDDVELFNRILDLESAARYSTAAIAFRMAGVSDFRAAQQEVSRAADKARLFAALDALTPAQLVAYGKFRRNG